LSECDCADVPRDPLAPVIKAADDLAVAKAGIGQAQLDAKALVQRARIREREARAELHRRMADAARAGVRQIDLIKVSGLTRERVRQILRAGGVEPD
jgi:hypothetical protein